ncbi:capsid maturation protease [Arthrobacter phage Elesar]|uniref:Capsid maturation protease n=1 Tax=Arthrobacter phage Elesar TaxID=2510522 RepID=A0A411CQ56_9CAUD|nr:capsid maturation protease [Arthrobacter phage Elesar]QAY16059.1 capsid maturation protease [Arthrobacter phage Elesar]
MKPQMLKPSAAGEPWYRMEATTDGSSAEIFIYDAIGGWFGTNASDFVRELKDLDVETIHLRVNSPGGDVYDGVAIMNALRRHSASVIATVDGIAASAASFIIQAADEVIMGRGTEIMIHEASAICWGNAADMEEMAGHLDRISGTIAGLYAERAGGTADEWRDAMKAETWYTADEAVKAGLADRVDGKEAEPDATNRFDLSVFAHAGRSNAPAPTVTNHERRPGLSLANGSALATVNQAVAKAAHKPPAEPKDTTNPQEEGTDPMSEKLIQGLRERLGIPAATDLDDDGILAAVDEALAETEPAAPAAPAPGTVVLDEDQYNSLRNDAAAGREARQQQLATARENLVDAAVNDGRISPARREHWINSLEADPGAAEVLASLEKGLIPLAAAGYTGGVDEASDEDRSYSNIFPKEA